MGEWLLSRPSYPCLSPAAAPSNAPCCWESRWRPRAGGRAAQTTASPQWRAVGDSSSITAQGVAVGVGAAAVRGWTHRTGSGMLPSPTPQASKSLYREVLGNMVSMGQKGTGIERGDAVPEETFGVDGFPPVLSVTQSTSQGQLLISTLQSPNQFLRT